MYRYSFVHVNHPDDHPGIVRAQRAIDAIWDLAARFKGARGASALVLAGIVAALMVVANQLVENWSDGHLLAAWIVMWLVAFAAIGLLAQPVAQTVRRVHTALLGWAARRHQARQDQQLWNAALGDARLMAEISHAMAREASSVRSNA